MKYFTAVLLLVCTVQALAHSNGDLRLVEGVSSSMGRVQLYYQGHWGGLCRSDNAVAQVICRSLGFSDSRPTRFYDGPSADRKLLDNIRCVGNETNILQCDHGAFGDVDCGYDGEMAVDCYGWEIGSRVELRNGTSTDGILVLGNNHGQIGTVCQGHWHHAESIVACRMLGVDTSRFHPVRLARTYYGEVTTDPSDLSDLSSQVTCHGNETNLTQCGHRGIYNTYCQHSKDVAIDCHGSENIEVSLVNGNGTAGEVQVTYRGESLTLCGRITETLAKVVCRMVGYGDYEGVMLDTEDIELLPRNSTRMTAQVDFWGCDGDEKDIAQCGLFLYSRCRRLGRMACRPQPDEAVRLVGGDARSGVLEIYRNGLWGSHCIRDDWPGDREDRPGGVAEVVCRMLKLPTENAIFSFVDPLILPTNAEVYYISCAGDEDNLNQCYNNQRHCYPGHPDVWISCA